VPFYILGCNLIIDTHSSLEDLIHLSNSHRPTIIVAETPLASMAARIFYEKDATLEPLEGKTIVFIGYGNQGRAQGTNIPYSPRSR